VEYPGWHRLTGDAKHRTGTLFLEVACQPSGSKNLQPTTVRDEASKEAPPKRSANPKNSRTTE